MDQLADISQFEKLINESNRSAVKNAFGWNKIKKAAIPLITAATLHGVPNAAHLNTLPAPEIPAIERQQSIRPEVQEAGADLYRSEQPWNRLNYQNFMKSRFGKDYRQALNPKEIEFLRDNREQNASFRELMKGLRERQAKHAQEERELERIYSGKQPYPTHVDDDFQRKVLEYGKPVK